MSKFYEKSYHRELFKNAKRADIWDLKPPIFFCETCTNCTDNRCSIFQRYVIEDYNRCFNHSNYTPIKAAFKLKQEQLKVCNYE